MTATSTVHNNTGLRKTKYKSLSPRFEWQEFTKAFLPKNIMITDLDGVARRASKLEKGVNEVLIYELKSYGSRMKDRPPQTITFQIIHKAMQAYNGTTLEVKAGTHTFNVKVKYLGFYEIVFLGKELDWESGVLLNGRPSSQIEIINLLSFKKEMR